MKPETNSVLPSVERLSALYALERVSGFGPVKFKTMHDAGIDPQEAIENPDLLPFTGRTGIKLREGIAAISEGARVDARHRALNQLEQAREHSASILTHGDPSYPDRVYASNNPVPVLYVRGDASIWDSRNSVAVVGSRHTREPYAGAARAFSTLAAKEGFLVVSGFALGSDSIGHRGALEAKGRTLCVMPCGLDNVFPPENQELWAELLAYTDAAFVSEYGFGQFTSSLLLRKRNKLITAFSQVVLVAQSAVDGGAMNAYRFGREQKKFIATYSSDGSEETSGNALIATDESTEAVVFKTADNDSNYQEWLNQLSFESASSQESSTGLGFE